MASVAASDARTQGALVAPLRVRLRTWQRAVCAAVSVVAVLGAGASLAAAPAQAASPWWHLESSARPTNLSAGSGRDEVQKLTVSAIAGEFLIYNLSTENFRLLPFDATAVEVQGAFEALYPGHLVSVTEEPGGEPDTRLFTLIFPSQALAPPLVNGSFLVEAFEGTPLSGGAHEARIEELEAGEDTSNEVILSVANLGDAATAEGTPVAIADALPPGLEAVAVEGVAGKAHGPEERAPVNCRAAPLTCSFSGTLPPYDQIEVRVKVAKLAAAATGEVNRLSVTGGGAPAADLSRPIAISSDPPPFGFDGAELRPEAEGGALVAQAGSHPFQLTTAFTLNQVAPTGGSAHYEAHDVAMPKDIDFRWPAGLLGNPSPFPQCTTGQFLTTQAGQVGGVVEDSDLCPSQTAVGVAMLTVDEPGVAGATTVTVPVFNLEPEAGEPARLGIFYLNIAIYIDPSLRSPGPGEPHGDYGIDISTDNIVQAASLQTAKVSVWGVPGDPIHDNSRGWTCLGAQRGVTSLPCASTEEPHPPAFLTLPTACGGPLQFTASADSWPDPGSTVSVPGTGLPALDGCNRLPFAPEVHAEPTSDAATSPTGLAFDLDFHDEGLLNGEGLAQSQMKKAVVTLPQGFTTNPSVAEGLKACSAGEYEASSLSGGIACTSESKVGEVEIESPLIEGKKVLGGLYVARQHENPFGNLLTIYLIARNPGLGVFVKQALEVTPDPVTGQLTTEVDNVPQLPFSRFHLQFRSGERSPLITPPACGTYTVGADLYPYSAPSEPVHRESSFQITQGPEGLGCPSGGVPPFHPNLEAGTLNNAAGTYSPFVTHITRKDSEQEITRFSIKLPTGLLAKLKGVSECSDAQIAAAKAREREGGASEEEGSPSCPASSEVGSTKVGTGVGNVLAYAGGKLYLAGPYHGSPISLVSVNYAKVGPFDLGTVVVRFALDINHETAEVSVDGANSDPIPHIVDGIPIHLRDIRAYVNRPGFALNPTSCAKKSTAATVLGSGLNFASSSDDVPVTVSSPFQAADCASLGFKPQLKVSLKGSTKRAGNPALTATVTYPRGSQANISKVVTTLPSSEFLEQGHIGTTCTRVQFNAGGGNGEQCPAKSIYGHATAITPLLEEPLTGPVFLRSNGGERQLPDMVAALHSKRVDIDLVGFIDSVHKKGSEVSRIRNTFASVPDAPVEKFTLALSGGKKSLLANSANLCAKPHRAEDEFTGQNGKVYELNPVIQVKCGKGSKKKKKSSAKGRGSR